VFLSVLGVLRGSSQDTYVELLTRVSVDYYNRSSNTNLKIFQNLNMYYLQTINKKQLHDEIKSRHYELPQCLDSGYNSVTCYWICASSSFLKLLKSNFPD
jgi:hypothetical protein